MIRILTPVDAARFTMADHPGEWFKSLLECHKCGNVTTEHLRCRAKMRGQCRRLAMYHVHHVCLQCGNVWITDGWRF